MIKLLFGPGSREGDKILYRPDWSILIGSHANLSNRNHAGMFRAGDHGDGRMIADEDHHEAIVPEPLGRNPVLVAFIATRQIRCPVRTVLACR